MWRSKMAPKIDFLLSNHWSPFILYFLNIMQKKKKKKKKKKSI